MDFLSDPESFAKCQLKSKERTTDWWWILKMNGRT